MLYKVALICLEEPRIRLEQPSRLMLLWKLAQIWSWMALLSLEVPTVLFFIVLVINDIYFFVKLIVCFYWVGVTSNTDAAHLAEFFAEAKCSTKVQHFSRFSLSQTDTSWNNQVKWLHLSTDELVNSRNYLYISGCWCSGHY